MNKIEKVQALATQIVVEEFSDKFVYHNLDYQLRLIDWINKIGKAEQLSEKKLKHCQIAAWLVYTGFRDLDKFDKMESAPDLFEKSIPFSLAIASEIMQVTEVDEKDKEKVLGLIKSSSLQHKEELTHSQQVFKDALRAELTTKQGFKHTKALYRQFLLTDALAIGKSGWFEMALQFIGNYKYHSEYGKNELQPKLENLLQKIEKESKKLEKQRDFELKRELDISTSELKQLKKNLTNSKGRDDRGIQTMFRTTSRNHYTLNAMVDRKASIMISVNAIILSLIIGGIFQDITIGFTIEMLPNVVLLVSSICSIFFAVVSILPDNTHGKFTREDIMDKRGNLLFFGNFHQMKFPDYEWGMLEMLSDQEYLYSTMIRDLYYLGKTLQKKYWSIRISLYIFIIGLITTSLLFLGLMIF